MTEFWESSYKDKQTMWGFEPADSAVATARLFKELGLKKILIPGFAYGRNAKPFTDNGCDVTGIEISQMAINLAKKHFGEKLKVHHGSVGDMPFDEEMYDGIFCYALIHLLSAPERIKLIKDCYNQLSADGYMVFVAISKQDPQYCQGKEISEDTFESRQGLKLFFYDANSLLREFGDYGLVEAEEIREPLKIMRTNYSQRFVKITCRKHKPHH